VASEEPLTIEQWRADLHHMAVEMERQHKDLFHAMTREDWQGSIERLDAEIPSLSAHEVIVGLARIANAVGDGHSGIRLLADPKTEFRSYPIKLHLLADGLFIKAAEERYLATVGGRVTQIGSLGTRQAIAAVAPLIARDNDQDLKTYAPSLLVMPEVLDAVGIIDDLDKALFLIELDGKEIALEFTPGEVFRLSGHSDLDLRPRQGNWVAATAGAGPTPSS